MDSSELLKDIISNGVATDLFDAEEILLLDELVGKNAKVINDANFGPFFGALQRYLSRLLILSVARIFESNNRFQIRSIPAALKIMRKSNHELLIPEKPTLISELVRLGYEEKYLSKLTDSELTQEVANYFEEIIPKAVEKSEIELESALYAIKVIRNKNVAHHESVEWENMHKPTYAQLRSLVEIAKDFVSVIGLPYLSTVYRCDRDEYLLTTDAGRASRCLERILNKSGVTINTELAE